MCQHDWMYRIRLSTPIWNGLSSNHIVGLVLINVFRMTKRYNGSAERTEGELLITEWTRTTPAGDNDFTQHRVSSQYRLFMLAPRGDVVQSGLSKKM